MWAEGGGHTLECTEHKVADEAHVDGGWIWAGGCAVRSEGGEGCEGAYGQSGSGFLRLGLFGVLFDGFQQVGDELGGR